MFDLKEYLTTPDWQKKRKARLCIDDFKCCRCGSPHNLQVHYTTYQHLGNEDVQNDLITLCDPCHEAIENGPRAGSHYQQPFKCSSNFGVKQQISLPVDHSIIYTDMKDIDATKQIQLKGGRIRLCRVHLCISDYLNNPNLFAQDRKNSSINGEYEDYQWECSRTWEIFVEKQDWIDYVQDNVVLDGKFEILQNGIALLHAFHTDAWESYRSITKREADLLIEQLDTAEKAYKTMACTVDTPHG